MKISAAPVVPTPCVIMAPSVDAKNRFGNDLAALGASAVTPDGPVLVRAAFNKVASGVIASNIVNDTLAGAQVRFEMPLTGIPYMTTTADVAAALRSLPGVHELYDGTLTDQPLFSIMARSNNDAKRLDLLLRDSVMLQGRGGYVRHAITITTGPIVEGKASS